MINTLMLSTLYKGVHYDTMAPYKQDIIKNHKAFAEFNNMEYRLYGGEIPYRFGLSDRTFTKYDIPFDILELCPGIGKLYAILAAQEDYPNRGHYVFVDFDSVFINKIQLNSNNTIIPDQDIEGLNLTVSSRQNPYLYDTSFLYYYCMYTGMTFDDIKHLRYRYNSGLFVVANGVITNELVNNYVDFCIDIHKKKSYYSTYGNKEEMNETHAMTLPYSNVKVNCNVHGLFHPSDEVFFQWLQIKLKSEGIHVAELNNSWNGLNIRPEDSDFKDKNHIHCIDKTLIPEVLKNSNI